MTIETAFRKAQNLLTEMVGFDTTSRNSNLAIIDYLEARLTALGARCERTVDATGTKANLHAVIGPDVEGGVVLSGHTDVVPVDGQDWSSDPFRVEERGGRLYGRGTCDMKGFIACALAASPDFAAANLNRPVHFAFSHDEEVGCLGAPAMIARMMEGHPKPALAIIGEPTEMKVVTGHKGLYSLRVEIDGHEAHSSRVDDGACAVTNAIPLLAFLHAKAADWRAAAPADSPFDPPFGTLTVGQMGGGTATNILARHAWFETLMRPAPWDDARAVGAELRALATEIEAQMRVHAPDARIRVMTRSDAPPLVPETDGAAEQLARALTGDNATRTVSFGSEAGQFQSAGLSVVVCGPGSIEQAHKPDEFIALSELEACCAFMDRLRDHLAG
ncbi:acetylornithine deacetylase [Hyphobacterium marinum]|uniref:Acetylornithine deacetylase n=1 Tax=Hyphobacterium marinum TaxID=3116574 RepID=A0ABU7M1I2_9PROT|nr:acetylornithine deacetylase [Hyphobacterium sp. Y6023]MEE2567669.1 acetylornithine deacetylase [Hyphobacterium sp. Y6023]